MDRAFVVMMNPKNGQILSMAGKKIVNKDGGMQIGLCFRDDDKFL